MGGVRTHVRPMDGLAAPARLRVGAYRSSSNLANQPQSQSQPLLASLVSNPPNPPTRDPARWRGAARDSYQRAVRLPKGPLNAVFQDALMIRPLPRTKTGGAQKIRYAMQLETETPTFVLHMNKDVDLHPSDQKYLENTIRKRWAFTATPLRLQFKGPDLKRSAARRAAISRVPQRVKRRPGARSARVQGR